MAVAITPRFILNLDDIPKVIEAEGRVWPVFMKPRDIARLFDVEYRAVRDWIQAGLITCAKVNGLVYISVDDFNAFVLENTTPRMTPEEYAERTRQRYAAYAAQAKVTDALRDEVLDHLVAQGRPE